MALETTALLGAGLLITILHTLAPDHWLPFALIGRSRGWAKARTLRLTLLSSVVHVGLTVLLGMVIAVVSLELLEGLEEAQGIISGAILVAVGLALALSRFFRREGHHVGHGMEGASGAAVFSLFALAPCYPILPLFLVVRDLGWGVTLSLAALFALVTVGMMTALVLSASWGIKVVSEGRGWARWERHEGFILGGILVVMGLVALWA